MKIFGYVLVGYLLLQILRQKQTVTSGANIGAGVLGQLLSFTPDQFQAIAAGVKSGQVTGLTTDQSGDLVVSLDPNAGADPLGLNSGTSSQPSATVNGVIGGGPAIAGPTGLDAIQGLV